jgi:hypothetical protein
MSRIVVTHGDPEEWDYRWHARQRGPAVTHPCPKGVSRCGEMKVKYEHSAIYRAG